MLFACGEPVSAERLADSLGIEPEVVGRLLSSLQDDYDADERGIRLYQMEDRWQLGTKNEYGGFVKHILDTRRNVPLTQAALEVLATIAYNQPVSRSFIEQVRGVDSSSTVSNLLEKGLIEEAGRLDLPGRPVSFCTTDAFLRTFGLKSLAQLPPLHGEELPLERLAEDGPPLPDDPSVREEAADAHGPEAAGAPGGPDEFDTGAGAGDGAAPQGTAPAPSEPDEPNAGDGAASAPAEPASGAGEPASVPPRDDQGGDG